MDTHDSVDENLKDEMFFRSNLDIWMVGFNYIPNHRFAFKFDIRNRNNLSPQPGVPTNETLYEVGLGIEF